VRCGGGPSSLNSLLVLMHKYAPSKAEKGNSSALNAAQVVLRIWGELVLQKYTADDLPDLLVFHPCSHPLVLVLVHHSQVGIWRPPQDYLRPPADRASG